MANYNVDIAVALKGAKQLTSFNREVKATNTSIDAFAKQLKSAAKDQTLLVKNFDNLNIALANAKKNFNEAAVGTSNQKKAAQELAAAQKDLNRELAIGNGLLKAGTKISAVDKAIARNARRRPKRDPRSGFRSFSERADELRFQGQSSLLPPRSPLPPRSSLDPGQSLFGQSVGGASDRARQILAEEQALQAALARMDQRDMKLTGQSVNIEEKLKKDLATQNANRKKTEKEVAQIRERLIKKEEKLNATRRKILKEEITTRTRIFRQNQFGNVNPGAGGFRAFSQRADQITANAAATANRPSIGSLIRSQFAPGGSFAATRGQRFRGAASNALIGGGFPLLFGQGALGAAGGGIGGALGGALGGGFGFGLSIAGTALAQQIQQTLDFRKSIRELNKEMEQMGISSNISGSQVRQLGKSLGITKEEAVKALQEFKRFGNQAILFAEKFGGDFAKFDAIAQANTVQSALAAIRKINKDLTLDDELRFINSVRRLGVEATINQMLDEMLEKEKKLKTAGFGQGEGKNAGANRKRLGQLNRERDATQELVDKNKTFSAELTIIRDKFVENRDAAEAANRSIAKGLEDVNAELRKLNDVQFQVVELSKTLGSAFSESFKGIIKGTMSVGDAFRNMFMRIADHFLDMAAQMMAAQISRGFMGMFGSIFSGFGGGLASSAQLGAQATAMTGIPSGAALPAGSFGISSITRAAGGPVKGGSSYIVGERGPEIFSPGVSGMITPNHALGGSTNIVVNVDASGSSVEGDEEQGRELGRMISVAIQSELIKQKRPGGMLA